ncbi:MAG: hypothetical protein EHM50_10285 [Lysobacterales bacterium]|nr:MAG: hypothetical protein EHM50_10285 [Xanthomonadales bacterium]
MTGTVAIRREHLVARYDAQGAATLAELEPLEYELAGVGGLPAHVRAASALRRFGGRLVIVQDDVNAFAVRDARGAVRPVLLPSHASGRRVFDDTLGNKADKLDLEACVTLPDGRLVAFGSGSTPMREQLVVWSGQEPPSVIEARALYSELRAAMTESDTRLNIEGAVVSGARLRLFHRGNDVRGTGSNAIADVARDEFVAWLAGSAASPCVTSVTTVDLGDLHGVPFGFTDAVALDDEHVVVLACAEDSACAISDGAVLGCRVGVHFGNGLRMVDICDASGERTLLKLEGIERRVGSSTEFDVVVDVDRPTAPAQLGRLTWEWR